MTAGPTRSDLSCPLLDEVSLCSLVLCTLHTLSNMHMTVLLFGVIFVCEHVLDSCVKVALYLVMLILYARYTALTVTIMQETIYCLPD